MEGDDMKTGFLLRLSDTIGAPEPAIRLLVSVLLGYPVALFNSFYLRKKPTHYQHIFFTLTGIGIGFFNFGWDISHSLGCVIVQYLLLKILSGTQMCVAVSFIFHMSYLLIGYYQTGTETYDIKWSMPHCVLTLRLIGLSFDYYDGKKKVETLTPNQKKMALTTAPSLLEMCGHVYFPGGFLVGPQFSMRRYLDFTTLQYEKECGDLSLSIRPGFIRFLMGLFYLVLYHIANCFISDDLITSDVYYNQSFLVRIFMVGIWGKVSLYRYISCWLFTEGVCIMSGLTYNGKDEKGNLLWNGCANVKLRVFENATRFGHLINSFNINTNSWVAEYIYKRLKFLGNRSLSQALTLLFLAIWHGFHIGYYVCFFMELIIMTFEKDVETLVAKNELLRKVHSNPKLVALRWIIGKVYVFIFMGYCLAPFCFFTDFWQIYQSLYYMGFVFFTGWICLSPFIMPRLIPRKSSLVVKAEPEKKED